MSFEYHHNKLLETKRALEDRANEAEQAGFRVRLTFQQDMDSKRCQDRPHSINLSLSKDVK